MLRRTLALFAAVTFAAPSMAAAQQAVSQQIPPSAWERSARTFPEFNGTWVLDEDDSRNLSGAAEKQIVITTTPTAITLMKTPAPWGPEVYRFDGTETNVRVGQGTLALVARALVLTMKRTRQARYEMTTVTTDAYSVSGDVLTIERQYSTIVRPMDGDKVGHIAELAEESSNGARVRMVYRRLR